VSSSVYTHLKGVVMGAKKAKDRWAVEVEHHGVAPNDYFSISSMLIDEDGVHIKVTDGPAIEFSAGSVRKILVMRVREK